MRKTELSDRGLVRLIPATYHKPPSLRGLVDSDEELAILAGIEGMTSARRIAEQGRNPHLDPRELAWRRRSRYLEIWSSTSTPARITPPMTAKFRDEGMPSRFTRFCNS